MIAIEKIPGEKYTANCYVLHDGRQAVVIDPGCPYDQLDHLLAGRELVAVLATHAHYDHVLHVARLTSTHGASFYLHPGDRKLLTHANLYLKLFHGREKIDIPTVDVWIEGGMILDLNFLRLEVLHTPGHTEGSVCYRLGDTLFTGDTLMKTSVGRTDLPGGNAAKIAASIKKIAETFVDATILPGHLGDTTLGEERRSNTRFIELCRDG